MPWANSKHRDSYEALLSAVVLFAAFPPLGWSWLAWIAPIGWLRLIRRETFRATRPYRMLYGVGFLYWLAVAHWIRLPHWSAYFGWPALAAYLGIYLPLFVAVSRRLVHRWKWPVGLAAPTVWAGLELFRGHFLSGYSLELLAHTQVRHPLLLQTCEWWGAYGLSFLIVAVAANFESLLWKSTELKEPKVTIRRITLPAASLTVILGGTLGYGMLRTQQLDTRLERPSTKQLKVAIVQGSLDTQFDGDRARIEQAFYDYAQWSSDAAMEHDDLQLMLWPESMFTSTSGMITYEEPLKRVDGWTGSVSELRQRVDSYRTAFEGRMQWLASQTETSMLVGTAWDHILRGKVHRYNAAVMFDARGDLVGRYDKMHPVMFGEYIPLGEYFPWLYDLTPMGSGLARGQQPVVFTIDGVRVSPSICFENTVPHLLRRQVAELAVQNQAPDLLATLSNDGWFWGSSLLDHHLACGVFRAVELRRPVLIAANTGLSAWVDLTGRILAEGPRRDHAVLVAEPRMPDRPIASMYLKLGDLPALVCLLIVLICVGTEMPRLTGWNRPKARASREET